MMMMMMMISNKPTRKIPRKFAEKIALLNKKESEANAEFESIIKEVERTTKAITAPKYIVGICKRRHSKVRGLGDNNLASSYVEQNLLHHNQHHHSHQLPYNRSRSSRNLADQYQSSYQLSSNSQPPPSTGSHHRQTTPHVPNVVPDITILAIDDDYTTPDDMHHNHQHQQVSPAAGQYSDSTATTCPTYDNGHLSSHIPYSRSSARSLPNIWDSNFGRSNNNSNYSSRSDLSQLGSMQRMNLEQSYNEAIANGNNNNFLQDSHSADSNNSYLNSPQQQVPYNSWNGSEHQLSPQLNQRRWPQWNQSCANLQVNQTAPLTRAVSSNCLSTSYSNNQREQFGSNHSSYGQNKINQFGSGYLSKDNGFSDNNYQPFSSRQYLANRSPHQQQQQLNPPSPAQITRSHSYGHLGDVNFYQNYVQNNNSHNANQGFYTYGDDNFTTKPYSTKHYHENGESHYHNHNLGSSYNAEDYNCQCHECSNNNYYPS